MVVSLHQWLSLETYIDFIKIFWDFGLVIWWSIVQIGNGNECPLVLQRNDHGSS